MTTYNSNYEIAQEISARIGTSPIPFDSVYSIALSIYQELGGVEEDFDSVYSILLGILPLVDSIPEDIEALQQRVSTLEEGLSDLSEEVDTKQDTLTAGDNITISGGTISANDTIEEVSELPEASENQDKLFRLDNGEKDVYAAKLLSSETTTTNRLPDAQQIDKAYLYESAEFIYYYKGVYKIVCSDGELNGYGWLTETNGDGFWWFELTNDNAVNVNENSVGIWYANEDFSGEIDTINHIITTELSIEDLGGATPLGDIIPIPATYNAPEANQIGNAYLIYSGSGTGNQRFVYTGRVEIDYDSGKPWYEWKYNQEVIYTNKKASEMYGDFENQNMDTNFLDSNFEIDLKQWILDIYIPQLNAPDSEQVGNAYIKSSDYSTYNQVEGKFYFTGEQKTLQPYDDSELITKYIYKDENNREVGFRLSPEEIYFNGVHEAYSFAPIEIDDIRGEVWSTDWYEIDDYSTIKYQRSETIEQWDWGEVINENIINDSSASTTSVYSSNKVDELLGDKANKVDYIVPLTLDVETYEYVPDYSVLNSATTDGSYTLKYVFTESNVDITVAYGNLQVSQGGILQTIHYFDGMLKYTMRMYRNNQWMALQEFTIPSIWQSNVSKDISSYSASKVDELLSALETRITALENGNS